MSGRSIGSRLGRRRLVVAAGSALALLAGLFAVSTTSAAWSDPANARADLTTGSWQWSGQVRMSGTSLCLDVVSRENANGQGVQLYACNSTPAQIWTFNTNASVRIYQVAGQWNATDKPTARCLDVNGSSTDQDVAMQIWACAATPGANQGWTAFDAGNGTVQVRSQLDGVNPAAPRCLDVPSGSQTQGTVVRLNSCTAANRARTWVMEQVSPVVY